MSRATDAGAAEQRFSVRVARTAARMRGDGPLVLLDAVLTVAAYMLILFIRLEGELTSDSADGIVPFLFVAVPVHIVANWLWQLYGQMWAHASVQEARRVVLAGMSALLLLLLLFVPGGSPVPRTVLFLGPPAAMFLLGAARFHARLFAFRRHGAQGLTTRVIVIGAGDTGAAIIREMLRDTHAGFLPVAVLDDDPRKQGRSLLGIPVAGGIGDLVECAQEYRVDTALLAISTADSELVRTVAGIADAAGLALKTLPSVSELVMGEVTVRDVRDLEITDLLGRRQVRTDLDAVRELVAGRRVLITGGGGTIGSEIARQVAALEPAALLILDNDETHLHDSAMQLPAGIVSQLLGDVREADDILELFERHRPEVVFHAAAHKHVPLLESHPCEAVKTNILGTINVLEAADRVDVENLVFISTDKAVQPSNVMGATKRIGEQLVLARAGVGRRYTVVRFGNVLGSRGSVIPLFMKQIAEGGPVTVTHADMRRYFMSISEAVQLVLQAAAFARGGEAYVLDMGEPVPIMELAERMIRLSGRRVGIDVPIRIVGLRPGEKLDEQLIAPDEITFDTPHASIQGLFVRRLDHDVLEPGVERLRAAVGVRDQDATRQGLRELAATAGAVLQIPEGQAQRAGVQRMER